MDLGIASGLEDFDDIALAEGLEAEIAGADGKFTGTGVVELPAVFDPVAGNPFGEAFVEGIWDGLRVL